MAIRSDMHINPYGAGKGAVESIIKKDSDYKGYDDTVKKITTPALTTAKDMVETLSKTFEKQRDILIDQPAEEMFQDGVDKLALLLPKISGSSIVADKLGDDVVKDLLETFNIHDEAKCKELTDFLKTLSSEQLKILASSDSFRSVTNDPELKFIQDSISSAIGAKILETDLSGKTTEEKVGILNNVDFNDPVAFKALTLALSKENLTELKGSKAPPPDDKLKIAIAYAEIPAVPGKLKTETKEFLKNLIDSIGSGQIGQVKDLPAKLSPDLCNFVYGKILDPSVDLAKLKTIIEKHPDLGVDLKNQLLNIVASAKEIKTSGISSDAIDLMKLDITDKKSREVYKILYTNDIDLSDLDTTQIKDPVAKRKIEILRSMITDVSDAKVNVGKAMAIIETAKSPEIMSKLTTFSEVSLFQKLIPSLESKLKLKATELQQGQLKLTEEQLKLTQDQLKLTQEQLKLTDRGSELKLKTTELQQDQLKLTQEQLKLTDRGSELKLKTTELQQDQLKLTQEQLKLTDRDSELKLKTTELQQGQLKLTQEQLKLTDRGSELKLKTTELQQGQLKLTQEQLKLTDRDSGLKLKATELEQDQLKLTQEQLKLKQDQLELTKKLELDPGNSELKLKATELEQDQLKLTQEQLKLTDRGSELKLKTTELEQGQLKLTQEQLKLTDRGSELKLKTTELEQDQLKLTQEQLKLTERGSELKLKATELEQDQLKLTQEQLKLTDRGSELKLKTTELEQGQLKLTQEQLKLTDRGSELKLKTTELEQDQLKLTQEQLKLTDRDSGLKLKTTELQQDQLKLTQDKDKLKPLKTGACEKAKELLQNEMKTKYGTAVKVISNPDDSKVITISDTHGEIAKIKQVLKQEGAIDTNGTWKPDFKGTVVIDGDIFTKGKNAKGIIDFLRAVYSTANHLDSAGSPTTDSNTAKPWEPQLLLTHGNHDANSASGSYWLDPKFGYIGSPDTKDQLNPVIVSNLENLPIITRPPGSDDTIKKDNSFWLTKDSASTDYILMQGNKAVNEINEPPEPTDTGTPIKFRDTDLKVGNTSNDRSIKLEPDGTMPLNFTIKQRNSVVKAIFDVNIIPSTDAGDPSKGKSLLALNREAYKAGVVSVGSSGNVSVIAHNIAAVQNLKAFSIYSQTDPKEVLKIYTECNKSYAETSKPPDTPEKDSILNETEVKTRIRELKTIPYSMKAKEAEDQAVKEFRQIKHFILNETKVQDKIKELKAGGMDQKDAENEAVKDFKNNTDPALYGIIQKVIKMPDPRIHPSTEEKTKILNETIKICGVPLCNEMTKPDFEVKGMTAERAHFDYNLMGIGVSDMFKDIGGVGPMDINVIEGHDTGLDATIDHVKQRYTSTFDPIYYSNIDINTSGTKEQDEVLDRLKRFIVSAPIAVIKNELKGKNPPLADLFLDGLLTKLKDNYKITIIDNFSGTAREQLKAALNTGSSPVTVKTKEMVKLLTDNITLTGGDFSSKMTAGQKMAKSNYEAAAKKDSLAFSDIAKTGRHYSIPKFSESDKLKLMSAIGASALPPIARASLLQAVDKNYFTTESQLKKVLDIGNKAKIADFQESKHAEILNNAYVREDILKERNETGDHFSPSGMEFEHVDHSLSEKSMGYVVMQGGIDVTDPSHQMAIV